MNVNVNPPRGTRDILPNEMRLRSRLLEVILSTFVKYGFVQIETPALESLQLLSTDTGTENTKLIFAILKRGEEFQKALQAQAFSNLADLGLRYDLTVPLARFYAANRAKLPSVFKSIQIGPVWRAERPQKGRFRQFYQCDIDILGGGAVFNELELLNASAQVLTQLGFQQFIIHLNDRRILSALLLNCGFDESHAVQVQIALDKLDKIGEEGVKKELLHHGLPEESINRLIQTIMQLKKDGNAALQNLAMDLKSYIDEGIIEDLRLLIEQLNKTAHGQYTCVFDPTLVRGMGYYTGQVFEITYKDYPFAIAGGGRYDKMIGDLINVAVPACGISLGFERLIVILEEEGLLTPVSLPTIALIYAPSVETPVVFKELHKLWSEQQPVTIYKKQKNFSKQLNELHAQGIHQYYLLENDTLSELKSISVK